jgi:O-antigen/teichoic acid export membrane protein
VRRLKACSRLGQHAAPRPARFGFGDVFGSWVELRGKLQCAATVKTLSGTLSRVSAWRETAWISGGQLAGAVGAVIGVRLLTTVLDPGMYGEFALALTAAAFVFQVFLGPLVNAAERYFAPALETGQTTAFFSAVRGLTLGAAGLIVGIGVVAVSALVLIGRTEWLPLTLAAVLFALSSGCESILDGVQNAARQRSVVAIHQAIRQWLRPILAVVLIESVLRASWVGMAAYCLASMAVLSSQFWCFRGTLRRLDPSQSGPAAVQTIERRMLTYAAPFGIWGVFTWMQMSSDRWALQLVGSSADVGLYAIVAQFGAYPLTLIGAMLFQVAAPIAYAQAGAGSDPRRTRAAVRMCAMLALGLAAAAGLLTLTTMVLHQQLFAFVVGAEYQDVSGFLPVAVLASGLFVVGQMLSLVPMVLGDSRALLAPKVGTAILALLLNLAGAYLFGLPGVFWAGVLFSMSYLGWLALVVRRMAVRHRQAADRPQVPKRPAVSLAEASSGL